MKKNIGLMAIIFLILILLVIILVFTVLEREKKDFREIEKNFSSCSILANSCNDQKCKYNFLCNEEENQNCNIYDCGKEYGVEITEMNGDIISKTRLKPDQVKIQETVDKCQGSIQILSKSECEDGKAIASVIVETAGECVINSFTMKVNGENRIAKFIKENDVYNLSVGQCGKISDIKVISGDGLQVN